MAGGPVGQFARIILRRGLLPGPGVAAAVAWRTTVAHSPVVERPCRQKVADVQPFSVDPELSLRAKSTVEIARAYSLLYLCSFPALVQNADKMLKWGDKWLGPTVTQRLLKHTFAAQYTGGETVDELAPMISAMNAHNVGAILDYVAEGGLDEDQEDSIRPKPGAVPPSKTLAETTLVPDLPEPHVLNTTMKDRRKDAGAVTHIWKDDDKCLDNVEISKTAITHAAMQAATGVTPFAAIKITALLRPSALLSVSRVLHLLQHTFPADAIPTFSPTETATMETPSLRQIKTDELVANLRAKFPGLRKSRARMKVIVDAVDPSNKGHVDYADWYNACRILWQDEEAIKSFGWDPIPNADREQVAQGIARATELAQLASDLGVRMMVDAEQTYFQNAIDMMVMQLQYASNSDVAVVFNTIQCYLKDARPRLHIELETHRRAGVKSGFKFVRGAYIVQEQQRATDMGYPDPICDGITATHANYDACVRDAIAHLNRGTELMVASHNQASVENAVNELARHSRHDADGVYFGQLLGMGDHLTAAIAAHGCSAYKYVPYGPVDECVAYLTRRVQENSTLLAGEPIVKERQMLWRELVRRATGS